MRAYPLSAESAHFTFALVIVSSRTQYNRDSLRITFRKFLCWPWKSLPPRRTRCFRVGWNAHVQQSETSPMIEHTTSCYLRPVQECLPPKNMERRRRTSTFPSRCYDNE